MELNRKIASYIHVKHCVKRIIGNVFKSTVFDGKMNLVWGGGFGGGS